MQLSIYLSSGSGPVADLTENVVVRAVKFSETDSDQFFCVAPNTARRDDLSLLESCQQSLFLSSGRKRIEGRRRWKSRFAEFAEARMAFQGLIPSQPPPSIKLTSVAHTLTTIATKGRITPATCKSWCCSEQKVERGFIASKPRLSEKREFSSVSV
jgi:hypothetical protein